MVLLKIKRRALHLILALGPVYGHAAVLPKKIPPSLEKGRNLIRFKKYKEARAFLEPLKLTQNDETTRKWLLARSLQGLKDYQSAEKTYLDGLSKANSDYDLLFNAACAMALAQNLEKALAHLQKIHDRLPKLSKQRKRFFRLMKKDSDLKNLKNDQAYMTLLDKMQFGIPEQEYKNAQDFVKALNLASQLYSDQEKRSFIKAQNFEGFSIRWEDAERISGLKYGPGRGELVVRQNYQHPASGEFFTRVIPVLRSPNFFEKEIEVQAKDFLLRTGNQKGTVLKNSNLQQILITPSESLGLTAGRIVGDKLSTPKTKILLSAQGSFVPKHKLEDLPFTFDYYNHQTTKEDPGVLTILASEEGSSSSLITNTDEQQNNSPGQVIYSNKAGTRSGFSTKKIFKDGISLFLLIQVPLKQKVKRDRPSYLEEKIKPKEEEDFLENDEDEGELFAGKEGRVIPWAQN